MLLFEGGMFSDWRPCFQLGELTFSYGVIIDVYYDTLPGITKCLLEAISLLVRSYATTKLAFFSTRLVRVLKQFLLILRLKNIKS